jgi:hypothetical protein
VLKDLWTCKASSTKGLALRIYRAVCELIEAHAARVRTETFEMEMENADWSMSQGEDLE